MKNKENNKTYLLKEQEIKAIFCMLDLLRSDNGRLKILLKAFPKTNPKTIKNGMHAYGKLKYQHYNKHKLK